MHGSAWGNLIRRIPEAHHDNLVAVTVTGAEIMVQRIMVVEEDYVIFRGRPAGSTDQPRVLLLPFDQVNHLAFNRAPAEADVMAMFGTGSPMPAPAAPSKAAAAPVVPEVPAEPPQAPPPAAPVVAVEGAPTVVTGPTKAAPPSKSILLARLRARLNGDLPKG